MTTLQERVNEILKANQLDFNIVKLPMVGLLPNGTGIDSEGEIVQLNQEVETPYFGLYNDKSQKVINTVKAGYTVSQNSEIVEMVLRGSEPFGDLSVKKAGSLNGGRKVFIQLGVDGFANVGNDRIKRNITVIDSNDGSTGLSVGIGDLTMSCSNQFYHFYKSGQMKARHTASIESKIKELPKLIELALSESMRQIAIYNQFISTACSRSLANELVNELLGFDRTSSDTILNEVATRSMNVMESLYANIETEMNSKGNNLWGLHSGVTRWTTHDRSAPKRDNGRIESSMLGTGAKMNIKSFDFALERV